MKVWTAETLELRVEIGEQSPLHQRVVCKIDPGHNVAVVEGNKKVAKARTVKTGQSYGGKITVTEGLRAGDQLVTAGYQDLVDGQAISY